MDVVDDLEIRVAFVGDWYAVADDVWDLFVGAGDGRRVYVVEAIAYVDGWVVDSTDDLLLEG